MIYTADTHGIYALRDKRFLHKGMEKLCEKYWHHPLLEEAINACAEYRQELNIMHRPEAIPIIPGSRKHQRFCDYMPLHEAFEKKVEEYITQHDPCK